jgi:hypothetical protein
MESFRRNLSENIFSKTRIFQNGIFQKESFRIDFGQTGIFQNGIFQKESFRNDFLAKAESFRMESLRRNLSELTFWPNRNLSEWNHSEGIFQKRLFEQTIGS